MGYKTPINRQIYTQEPPTPLAKPSRIKQRPAVRRHLVRRPRRRREELLKGLQALRELPMLLHDLLVPPLEVVYVLGRLGENCALQRLLARVRLHPLFGNLPC